MLDTDTAARLDAIGKLGFTNPFGPERPRLEAVIVGEDVARSLPWSRSLDWPLEDPALPAIQEEAERQMAEAQAGLARGKAYTKRERDLIRGVALYVLYYRYDTELYQSITSDSPANTVTFYDAFNNDFHELFKWVEPPTWAATPADLFALFFQTRRAFHFVFHQILGTSVAAAKLRANVWESLFTHDPWRYLAHLQGRMHEASTLILGPSGTGKELVASAIGLSSFIAFDDERRRFARDYRTGFHPLHLAAMSKTLIESELFGHKKGAFTGASADRMGHLEGRSASETIFLDEIGELDPEIQVKLLRVLQSRAFHRLGDTEPRSFGGKVVAATNRDLSREMEAGRFREDLYYRLCSDVIQTPSLQEQVAGNVDELGHLVSVLVQRTLGSSDSATFEEIMSGIEQGVGYDYPWPGNIRELEQCVRNLLIHGHYHPPMAPSQAGTLDPLFNQMQAANATLDEVVSTYTTWVYTQRGSYTQAATTLEIDRRTVAKHIGDT
ncbi:MAG: sigma 54-interacting transcriptional regulator [Deltaproteobacteria bacterium]|nr:sigma 54-interacting transcriptional regulator [Deltaproteobacteria bacterium]MBW1876146.1 sigma 54-interacting transcriptional regulator [Deltaproteobacteria bacterium]MBW2211721.1 sigma 54-interacting transcriptional regulator [Deltaproteobacteria bacterium]MBW2215040.1 sigma 54-interacting transcriptional regulator [Deltaproteobacteria bacterium]MBW2628724.1 sigma 54-interacting transcriptional regulator [Deltaproteobacteria bacterium]